MTTMVSVKKLRACALLFCFNFITNGFSVPNNSYTCIIGGGYSGLATARYLKQFGLDFILLERSKAIGGTWRFDPHVGVDEDGVPVSTSQYKNLRTNSPRHTMEYSGFPFPEHTQSYLTGTCFYKYMKSFVKHFDLMTNIQVRSYVTSVRRKKNVWELLYHLTDSKKNRTLFCDFVVVATGRHIKPHLAKFVGLNNFKAALFKAATAIYNKEILVKRSPNRLRKVVCELKKISYFHDYKAPDLYKDRKVLVVGAGASGLDISVQLHKIARKLIHSHHFVYNQPNFSERYVKKPDIKEFVYNGAIVNDSSFEAVEDVILATGYRLEHPFLDESSGLFLTDMSVLPLHNQIVNIRQPSMMFVGISQPTINRVLDAQAEYVSLLISGKFELPTKEIMLERWLTKYSARRHKDVNLIFTELEQYVQNLTQEAGVTVPPVLIDVVFESIKNLIHDLFHYRDYEFEIIDSQHFTSRLLHNITNASREKCPIEDINLKENTFYVQI